MRVYEFERELVIGKAQVFPDEICDDLWIVYHGTSSISEEEIDRCGLQWRPTFAKRAEVEDIVSIFDTMSWAGKHGGGFPVLKPFSLNHDFAASDRKPIFFAESSYRALLYATRDFAGGETTRALRLAFADLQEYLSSPDLRHSHMTDLWREYHHLKRIGAAVGNPPSEINLSWLHSEVKKLEELETRCREAFEIHRYGIVYAIRFNESDLSLLESSTSMGIKAPTVTLPEKIIAKVRVPKAWQRDEFREDDRCLQALLGDGIAGRLRTSKHVHDT